MWPKLSNSESCYDKVEQNDTDQGDRHIEEASLNSEPIRSRSRCSKVVLAVILLICLGLTTSIFVSSKLSSRPTRRCTSSPQVRREWRQLNEPEKSHYIDSVKCLQQYSSITTGIGHLSDDFAWVHRQMNLLIHQSALFLPYHRYMIHIYEQYLQKICGYSGVLPYWDWSLDWEDPTKSAIWDPVNGFGGDGNLSGPPTVGKGFCIGDGPFADYEVLWYNFTPRVHCLSRSFGCQNEKTFPGGPFKPTLIQDIMQEDNFWSFTEAIESGPHDNVPNNICGDFFSVDSPNDPVFFLHHANLDRLWWKWQRARPGRLMEYNGSQRSARSWENASLDDVVQMKGLGEDVKVREVMDTESGEFCYGYSRSGSDDVVML